MDRQKKRLKLFTHIYDPCHHVTVGISKANTLSDTGLLQSPGSLLKSKKVCLFEGIVDTSNKQAAVQIVNIGKSEATIFSGTPVGTCESYYEMESAGTLNCAATNRDVTEPQLPELLPEHLQDMWEGSKTHPNDDDSEILADLRISTYFG